METYFGEIEQARSRITLERALADFRTLARDTEALVNATAHDASRTIKEARDRVAATLDRAKSTWIEFEENAAALISAQPIALQLRFLQTMREISGEHNTTKFLPLPLELFNPYLKAGAKTDLKRG
jgi:ElaB/YqjD/DUF883 family membrane-anchored ribosome-binding protein